MSPAPARQATAALREGGPSADVTTTAPPDLRDTPTHRQRADRQGDVPRPDRPRPHPRPEPRGHVDGEIRVVEITRAGRSLLPAHGVLTEPGDLVTFSVAATALARLSGFLGKELGT